MMKTKSKDEAKVLIDQETINRMYEDMRAIIHDIPEGIPDMTVSQYAERYRTLPPGTPYPGSWRNDITPYMVEIMDNLSVSSPTQEVVFCKSAQVGATAGLMENFIAYCIDVNPSPILYVTANLELLKSWTDRRLAPLLISCNLDRKIKPQYLMKGQKGRSGNRAYAKEFPGGFLQMNTANSAAGLRMESIRNLLMDEIDAYRWDVGGEGKPTDIAEARTKNWGRRKKIVYNSTPTTTEETHIWPLFESGDRRYFFVPCPHCGEFQPLEFGNGESHGFHWDTKAGILDDDTIYYQCIKCRNEIFEVSKQKMVRSGHWEPTGKTSDKYRKSYHIWAAYSVMAPWRDIIKNRIKAEEDPEAMRAHMNLDLGLPYLEPGERPPLEKVIGLRGTYKRATVPRDVLYLTAAVDVQLGSSRVKSAPARLEMEICGHGYAYRTWSIDYKVFEGSVDNPHDGAWEKLDNWARETQMRFYRAEDQMVFAPVLIFVDASDGKIETVVAEFCQRWINTFPIKAFADLKKKMKVPGETLDEMRYRDGDRWRPARKEDYTYYMIATNWYKRKLYANLKIKRIEGNEQRPNFCDFPTDYPDDYFEMLTAEERRRDGSFYKPSSRRNEALDLRVYNLAAAEIWLAAELAKYRAAAIKSGMSKREAEFIHTRHVIERLKKLTELRRVDS
jgi:phage terminase large subunit GpA-like protein